MFDRLRLCFFFTVIDFYSLCCIASFVQQSSLCIVIRHIKRRLTSMIISVVAFFSSTDNNLSSIAMAWNGEVPPLLLFTFSYRKYRYYTIRTVGFNKLIDGKISSKLSYQKSLHFLLQNLFYNCHQFWFDIWIVGQKLMDVVLDWALQWPSLQEKERKQNRIFRTH